MFIKAIEIASSFTRPIYFISRNYGSNIVQPGTATLFFINSEGWALTCGHVANQLIAAETINQKYTSFKNELKANVGHKKLKPTLNQLKHKYGLTKKTTFELYSTFVNCIEGTLKFQIIKHPKADLALIKFSDFSRLLCDTFPIFPKNTSELKQGKILCRLGFPFPEFTNYSYDSVNDRIQWTDTGKNTTPRFPIEGMVTRYITDGTNIIGFELSTPGLRGQSGGPAFDVSGKIWGMQSSTNHLYLDFDVNQDVITNGTRKRVTDSAFLHVGRCVHVDIIKRFLSDNDVEFNEE